MAYFRCGGGGIPSSLKTDMNTVYNKKFGTSTTYDPSVWASTANLMGPLPERTATGSIAHITDGADEVPIKSWGVEIAPTLTGKSAVGVVHTGINIFNQQTEIGGYNTSDGNANNLTDRIRNVGYISVKPSTQYYFYNGTDISSQSNINIVVLCYDENKQYTGSYYYRNKTQPTLSNPANSYYIRFYCATGYGTTYNNDISINYPATETGFNTYNGTTSTVNLGRTIYGGTAEVVNGQGESTHANVKVSDLTWTKQTASGRDFFISQVSNMKTGTPKEIASVLPYGGEITVATMADKSLASWTNSLRIYDTDITTVSELLEAYGNDGISYPLATPETFTFTPITPTPETALGVNNFWADEGDTEVTYRADINLALGGQ